MEDGMTAAAGSEVFALTDEQIVGLGTPEVASGPSPSLGASEWPFEAQGKPFLRQGKGEASKEDANGGKHGSLPASGQAEDPPLQKHKEIPRYENAGHANGQGRDDSGSVSQEAPGWLAERMRDPWHGEEAKEFWEGKQRLEKEAAAYREAFATPEDARALKEIYPGGVGEAKSAAERARALDEIDAAFYRGDAAARMQLAQRMMAQDPSAFREMVEAGLRLLGNSGERSATSDQEERSRSLAFGPFASAQGKRDDGGLHARAEVSQEVVRAYGELEKSANAELEKSVGGVIARAMEQALPNLRTRGASGGSRQALRGSGQAGAQGSVRDDPLSGASGAGAAPLQERLASAVREEVEAGLKSDRQLGEQVAKLLAGRRFDRESRAQVVRLIDARAQQLVPGAVKRVVNAWTQTTLAAHAKETPAARTEVESAPGVEARRNEQRAESTRKEMVRKLEEGPQRRGRRVDYGRWSDEEIVGL